MFFMSFHPCSSSHMQVWILGLQQKINKNLKLSKSFFLMWKGKVGFKIEKLVRKQNCQQWKWKGPPWNEKIFQHPKQNNIVIGWSNFNLKHALKKH
jgi:hypothetical protein